MNRRNCWFGFVLLVMSLGDTAWAWQPAEGPLKTRWTKEVSPERALPEYPRPQMVRKEWTNLNGLWDYAIRPRSDEAPARWDGEILVPYPVESALSGVKKTVSPEQRLWYHRYIDVKPKAGERVLLHFGAVDWRCTVWVNDKQVGQHSGGYDPFTIDITDALRDDRNDLAIAVWDPTDTDTQPRGKQVLKPHGIFYTAVTGIWQTVWLESVPERHIRSLSITHRKEPSGAGSVTVDVEASMPGKARARILVGNEEILSTNSDRLSSTTKGNVPAALKRLISRTQHLFSFGMTNFKVWSPDDPFLYDLEIELLDDAGNVVDKVGSYFGMRTIEVKKDAEGINRLFLNNKPVFQYGPLDQGWWPDGLYTAPTDEALKYDIEMTKKFGMNMIRKHVKVEPARWYYWCDKLGILVWQDMVSGDAHKTDESKKNYRTELKAMIDALRNSPAIVMWVPFNEGWGQHETPEIAKWVKEYDPSRPVNEASGWNDKGSGDVSDMHAYPGPGTRDPEDKRVAVLGEFGGLGMPEKGHTWQAEKNWGYVSYDTKEKLTDAYVDLLTAMRPLIGRGLSAAVYTQTTDVEIEVNGLMTYDREVVKMDLDRIRAAAEKLYAPAPKIKVVVPSSEKEPQTWRYTTTKPSTNWYEPDFNDKQWKKAPASFGAAKRVGPQPRTNWDTPDIWMRRTFDLKSAPKGGRLALSIYYDDDSEIYLNGTLARELKRHANNYQVTLLDESANRLLKSGSNTIAVHCKHTDGGQYIDAGLVEIVEH